MDAADIAVAPPSKRARMRLAKAELISFLSMKADEWAEDVGDRGTATIPFAEWHDDDPFRDLALRYDLTGADLARLLDVLSQQLEDRAERAGFDEAWR